MNEQKTTEQLKQEAFEAMHKAEAAMYKYAASLDVGNDREKAFNCFENIRTAWRNA